ncbi:BTB/POZ domain-containing protein 7 isoform X2 [Anthonomus grandis grandis]|uniref:BTB/POZ domain-containing protein 7 isoform X2 n=1 Tax=Anthonomus grandis grandis TaxID=2921223 RepID=UPI002165247D|nr:BTB/POZ domain-containing protein 7 isoform X2 [Anthonomus grandis grandis]
MSLFGCLFPCAPQPSWRGALESERCMSERMGASASASQDAEGAAALGLNNPGLSLPHGHHAHLEPPPPGAVRQEKKKRVTGFATLKKKFIRRRRSSKACDHGRVLRELVSDWSPMEIAALLEEYEALQALKDLCVQAELARPPAATFKQDLSALYDFKYCTDADLVYRGACFPIHRALVSARCPYFRDLLAGCPGYGARICLDLRSPSVDVQLFSALLRYLYTGDICHHNGNIDLNLLRRLREEFGSPNALEDDLRYLLESGDHADAALVFTEGADGPLGPRPDSAGSEYGFRPRLELPCHRAVLAARSPFFRSLLTRRVRSQEERQPTRIVLDEGVIPKRYAKVLLHAVYLDQVDLSLISRGGCGGGLGEAQALAHTGRVRPSPLEEAMELYQIGRFLELDILAQGCEDLILEALSLETLPSVLQWSKQPHGSAWVHRQAMHFLREEFQPVAQSPVLHQLDKGHIIEVLKSPFLQASELEVLQAVLKWGEHELVRRMEDREISCVSGMFSEPNVVSHTAHSVSRKGVKKRDLNDIELREILSDLLPWVRMDHVLPPNSDALVQAIRRGLVSTPPSHMVGGERELRVNSWIRGTKANALFVQPRLFIPYYDELKALVEDQMLQEAEMLRGRRVRYVPDPDVSFMPDSRPSGVDILGGAPPVPDAAVVNAMLKREQKLRQAPSCQLAMGMPLSCRAEIGRQIRLRVVREFNLPDNVADALEAYRMGPQTEAEAAGTGRRSPARRRLATPPRRLVETPEGRLPDVTMAPSTLVPPPAPSELRLDLGDGGPLSRSTLRSAYRLCPPGPPFAPPAAPVPRFL